MRRSPYLIGAGAMLALALALAVLLGSSMPGASPTPSPLALASPTAPAVPAVPGSPNAPTPSAGRTPAPSPSPSTSSAVPAPGLGLPTPLDDYYPSIAPSSPLSGTEPGSPDPRESALPAGGGRPTRVVFASLNIDLPVVAGDLRVRGNRGNYPLCDVAQYFVELARPGQKGTAYIYAHAQRGMFLPMLRASWRNGGRHMLGARVEVYTSDARLHVYEIVRVKRHSTNLNIAFNLPAGEHQLVLQTSEGPPGHRPVLQVAARPVSVSETTRAKAMPEPRPRVCLPPR